MRTSTMLAALGVLSLTHCQCGEVGNEEQARMAYLGMDPAVGRAMALGFVGFNAAQSANIPVQNESGELSGTMQVSGQVDQGSSANKGMRLKVALTDYADPFPADVDAGAIKVTYATASDAPLSLDLQLKDIPNGTVSGTMAGNVAMQGDLRGDVALTLSFSGAIEEDPQHAGQTRRQAGSLHVTGTATSSYGDYAVDLTR